MNHADITYIAATNESGERLAANDCRRMKALERAIAPRLAHEQYTATVALARGEVCQKNTLTVMNWLRRN